MSCTNSNTTSGPRLTATELCGITQVTPPSIRWAHYRRDLRSTKKGSVSSPKDFPKIVIDSDRISCYLGICPLPYGVVRWVRYRSRLKNKREWFLSIPKRFSPPWARQELLRSAQRTTKSSLKVT